MYRRLTRAAHHRGDADAGLGMIMVIALAGVMTLLVGVLITVVSNSLAGSSRHQHFDVALTSAESGIDQSLSRLETDYDDFGGVYLSPNVATTFDASPACNAAPIAWGGPFTGTNAERDWARTQILNLVKAHPECIQKSESGEFAAIAPSGVQAVYSLGWSPSYGAEHAESRLIKAEYLFVPYAPSNAILTGCNLELDSSTTVKVVPGADQSLATVHSNCEINSIGNPVVTGSVSSTGTNSGQYRTCIGCTSKSISSTPTESVPHASAAELYTANAVAEGAKGNWFDLCPDGTVKVPVSIVPCSNTVSLADTATTTTSGYRGWQFMGATAADDGGPLWAGMKTGIASGTYYIDAGSVTQLGANPYTDNATIIASAQDDTVCPKVGGTINWNKNNFGAPALTHTFMWADADLSTGVNFYAGGVSGSTVQSGLFWAGDQINMQTSAQGAYGSVIAADQCPADPGETNVVKNPTVTYDPNAAAPFTSIIDTSLWLEYAGQ